MTDAVLLRVPCPDQETARALSRAALKARLIACANLSQSESIYRWQGKIETATETVALFKTRHCHLEDLLILIRSEHPYDQPAVTWFEANSSVQTASWLLEETSPEKAPG